MRTVFWAILLLCWGENSLAQLTPRFQLGAVLNLGTHIQHIGLQGRVSLSWQQVQVDLQTQLTYQILQLGSGGSGWEFRGGASVLYAWGPRLTAEETNPFLFLTANQLPYPYSVAYTYQCYVDQQQTSQLSGALGIGIRQFYVRTENDFLAFQSEDRYRSGAVEVGYWEGANLYSLRSLIWTGDPYYRQHIEPPQPLKPDDFPASCGYLPLEGVPYGDRSVGTLSFRITRQLPFGQTAFFDLGWDAEQIRNVGQNRLIHANPLLPINWFGDQNPHIPMLDTEGKEYLYLPEQQIRPGRFYGQMGLNQFMYF